MGPEAGDGGGQLVVEGPPEDIRIHDEQWVKQQGKTFGKETHSATTPPLLRSHTGEALKGFV